MANLVFKVEGGTPPKPNMVKHIFIFLSRKGKIKTESLCCSYAPAVVLILFHFWGHLWFDRPDNRWCSATTTKPHPLRNPVISANLLVTEVKMKL